MLEPPQDPFWRRLSVPLFVLACVIVGGTLGYYLLWLSEGGSLLDAAYMTFITITTVGYSEIYPLGTVGRIFTILVALTGIGSLFYLFSVVMDRLVSLRLDRSRERRDMAKTIAELEKHIILVGLGRMGKRAAAELLEENKAFVVIDADEAVLQTAAEEGYYTVLGDASEDEVLQRSGVTKASGLISTTGDDASNAFIVMSARALNAKLLIIARAESEASVGKLQKAGADKVLDPYSIGGRRLANLALHPAAIDFLETTLKRGKVRLDVEAFAVLQESQFEGRSLLELDIRKRCGVNILAVLRGGEPIENPGGDFTLQIDDQLIALGTQEQLTKLEQLSGS